MCPTIENLIHRIQDTCRERDQSKSARIVGFTGSLGTLNLSPEHTGRGRPPLPLCAQCGKARS
ncbi:hypothetical protein HAX54_030373, partial [Datura stramonium]|nr:hypothetical protein [Datura stramonium]